MCDCPLIVAVGPSITGRCDDRWQEKGAWGGSHLPEVPGFVEKVGYLSKIGTGDKEEGGDSKLRLALHVFWVLKI